MIPGLDSEALFGAMSRASTERWGSWSSDLMDAPMDYEGDTCAEIVERFVANGQIERVDAVDAGSAVDASTDSDDSMAPSPASTIAPFQPRDAPLQPRDSDDSMAPVLSDMAWERLPLLVVGWIDSGDNSSSSSSWIARMPEHVRCAARDIYRRRVAKAVRGQKRQADDLQCEVGSGSSHSAEVGGFEQM